ncbi:SAM-dependent methyltransferase [Solihabitans fulvus]|uniref:SAM-dependent methyltransferase n=1 Tax=Solihabitans fulvus TaxID=1892852 RepID=UPI001CB760A8|nr:SAM-dependent methyltransferase [Solihabitans fulvus]
MQDRPNWVPSNVDVERPNFARLYDYYLGGAHNFAVDRALAEQSNQLVPGTQLARNSRTFLRRAVRLCVDRGVTQFLDLGSGLPTAGNVHEVAQAADRDCRVVYVDNEPVTVAHGRAMLRGNDLVGIVLADLRDVRAVLAAQETRRLLDFDRPVAVLMSGVLHFVPDSDRPAEIVAAYLDAAAPDSLLALSHVTGDVLPDVAGRLVALAEHASTPLVTPRTREQIGRLFGGLELLDPGLTFTARWRCEQDLGWGRPPADGVEAPRVDGAAVDGAGVDGAAADGRAVGFGDAAVVVSYAGVGHKPAAPRVG